MTDVVRTLWEFLGWAMTPKWNGVPVAGLAELAIGGLMLMAMSRATSPKARVARAAGALAIRQPGWLVRRRAASSIRHAPDRVGVGYQRAIFGAVHLGLDELNHHCPERPAALDSNDLPGRSASERSPTLCVPGTRATVLLRRIATAGQFLLGVQPSENIGAVDAWITDGRLPNTVRATLDHW